MKNILYIFTLAAVIIFFTSCEKNEPEFINAPFSVGPNKQVYFSKGNLQATYDGSKWTWGFAKHQWEFIGNAAANTSITGDGIVSVNGTVDLFGWSTPATQYGINNSKDNSTYAGIFEDWGHNIGAGWYTLTSDQWLYLFHGRPHAVKLFGFGHIVQEDNTKVNGVFLLPDDWDDAKRTEFNFHPADAQGFEWQYGHYSLRQSSHSLLNEYVVNTKDPSKDTWTAIEKAGVVFLPAAGCRMNGYSDNVANYWSSTPYNESQAYYVTSNNYYLWPNSASAGHRYIGQSVRLVR